MQPVGGVTAVQLKLVEEDVVPEAVNAVGALGAAEQLALEQVPVAVQGWPEPAPPLLVAGL